MSILSVVAGLVLVLLGVIFLRFNYQLANNFGAPAIGGTGDQYTFYKLVAVIMIGLGLIITFNLHTVIIQILFSPFEGLLNI